MDKELFIMRHGKSSWNSDAPDDKSRPLNQRGFDAAARVGDGLNRLGWLPEKIIVSPAKRARQTCELLHMDVETIEDERLYEAGLNDLFSVIGETPETTKKLMLIGHNPGLEMLLLHLAPNAERQKNGKLLTTANVVRIGFDGKWDSLKRLKCQLLGHIRPKEMDH